jgi:hypothetical protein
MSAALQEEHGSGGKVSEAAEQEPSALGKGDPASRGYPEPVRKEHGAMCAGETLAYVRGSSTVP